MAVKPFTMFPNEILDNPAIDIYMQSVLLALYRFRDQNSNTCFPSYEVLAQYSKCCVRKVKSVIKKLEEMALIAVHRRGRDRKNAHASNVYILPGMTTTEIAPDSDDTAAPSPENLFSLERIPAIKQKQADVSGKGRSNCSTAGRPFRLHREFFHTGYQHPSRLFLSSHLHHRNATRTANPT